ncbi:ABC transporter ATP-binding protein [Methylophaga muralis]|uniref:ABC-type dipeptide transporter n=1 Tax=Methylophaga muralis TaxID=291169 RepID=A0A1E3GR46_9GAMM|nr:ABC transporter ATP-binding protein [Methylophaga muralis]ODN65881.1 Glutathione import ATP-binding protein GsiA [Methylophaga muralis]
MTSPVLLEVKGLKTWFLSKEQPFKAVDGIDFSIQQGETFALLGESGCGKSISALSLLRLNPYPASKIVAGEINLNGLDLLKLSEAEMESVRGRRVAMIFQEPQSSLNPVLTIGQQIGETLRWHFKLSPQEIQQRSLKLLDSVGIPDPIRRLKEYPHQMSGGMKQRVMIAMALAGEPELLIADEPTTALDVTIQAQILDLLKQIQRDTGMAILLITHDLGVAAQMADHIAVMYAGQIVEQADRQSFFANPQHPYAKKLFEALPSEQKRDQRLTVIKGNVPPLNQTFIGCRFADRCDLAWDHCHQHEPSWIATNERGVRCHLYDPTVTASAENLLKPSHASHLSDVVPSQIHALDIRGLKVHFPIRKGILQRQVGQVKAVDGVNLTLHNAETLALVGESGCGKTTVGKGILQLVEVTAGEVRFQGKVLNRLSQRQLKPYRGQLQIIFQDPFSSMNPRMTIEQVIDEAISASKFRKEPAAKTKYIDSLLERVGLRADIRHRYPHEFSGGQRQRICIARALATEPEVIVCDEPTSALDVSVQAQILNLLRDIQHEFGLSFLFITHNIGVVDYLAHRVAVMYLGRIVEQGTRQQVLDAPKHPYTQALLAAVPDLNKQELQVAVRGELPSPANPPAGCHFHQRCQHVMPICHENYPPLTVLENGHQVNCFLYEENEYGSTNTN